MRVVIFSASVFTREHTDRKPKAQSGKVTRGRPTAPRLLAGSRMRSRVASGPTAFSSILMG